MLQTYKSYTRRTLAMLLAVLVAVGALFSGSFPVHAADGTISYKAGANIPYGWSYVKKKYKLNMPFFRLAYPAKASAFSSNAA